MSTTELHRTIIDLQLTGWVGRTCDWCGQARQRNGKTLPSLFAYSAETDGGRKNPHAGLFCSKSCHDDYHG